MCEVNIKQEVSIWNDANTECVICFQNVSVGLKITSEMRNACCFQHRFLFHLLIVCIYIYFFITYKHYRNLIPLSSLYQTYESQNIYNTLLILQIICGDVLFMVI